MNLKYFGIFVLFNLIQFSFALDSVNIKLINNTPYMVIISNYINESACNSVFKYKSGVGSMALYPRSTTQYNFVGANTFTINRLITLDPNDENFPYGLADYIQLNPISLFTFSIPASPQGIFASGVYLDSLNGNTLHILAKHFNRNFKPIGCPVVLEGNEISVKEWNFKIEFNTEQIGGKEIVTLFSAECEDSGFKNCSIASKGAVWN